MTPLQRARRFAALGWEREWGGATEFAKRVTALGADLQNSVAYRCVLDGEVPATLHACRIAASLALDGAPSRGPYLSTPCRPVAK